MNSPKKSFLIIGSAGMAGHMVYTFLKERGHDTFGIDIRQNDFSVDEVVDTGDSFALRQVLCAHNADCVVNCAAILGKPMHDHPELAKHINSEMPHEIADILRETNSHLFHVSTDFLFSGNRVGGGYREDDAPDNETIYGLLKRQGEVQSPLSTNIRLSIIGPTPKCIVPNFLNNVIASDASSLWGLTNAFWTGITTLELAKSIEELCCLPFIPNIVHLCSKNKESRFETIKNIQKVFSINLPLEERQGEPKDYSLLSSAVPYRKPFIEQIFELKDWMRHHLDLYGSYACL